MLRLLFGLLVILGAAAWWWPRAEDSIPEVRTEVARLSGVVLRPLAAATNGPGENVNQALTTLLARITPHTSNATYARLAQAVTLLQQASHERQELMARAQVRNDSNGLEQVPGKWRTAWTRNEFDINKVRHDLRVGFFVQANAAAWKARCQWYDTQIRRLLTADAI